MTSLSRDGDLRGDFLVEQLLDAQVAPQLRLQIVHGHLARVELLLKFLLRVGRFQLVELGLHVGVDGHQAQLLGALQHDLVVDQVRSTSSFWIIHLVVAGPFARTT